MYTLCISTNFFFDAGIILIESYCLDLYSIALNIKNCLYT
jgi:hypothetical protein